MRYWPQKPPLGVPVNWGDPLALGLVGCWLMNEGSGNKVYDLSGNGNTEGFVGSPTWVPAQYGNGIKFPSTAGNSLRKTNPVGFGLEGTFIWSVKLTNLVNNSTHIWGNTSEYAVSAFTVSASTNLRIQQRNTANVLSIYLNTAPGCLVANKWTTFAYTWSQSQQKGCCYVDGKFDNSSNIATFAGTLRFPTTFLDIGYYAANLDGTIEYVYGYNCALTAQEIQQLYMTPFRMFERPSIELWTPAFAGQEALEIYCYDTE